MRVRACVRECVCVCVRASVRACVQQLQDASGIVCILLYAIS